MLLLEEDVCASNCALVNYFYAMYIYPDDTLAACLVTLVGCLGILTQLAISIFGRTQSTLVVCTAT